MVTCNYSQDTNSLLIELEFVDGNKITFQVSKIYDHCKSYHESQGGIILVRPRNEFGQSIPVEVCGMGGGDILVIMTDYVDKIKVFSFMKKA